MTAAVIAVSAGLVAWARTDPSYDAFGWLVLGFQTVHGTLDLGGAPSWKPLPYVFTAPYALFSMPVEKWLWMVTCVGVSLSGPIFAGRISYRLTLASLGLPAFKSGAGSDAAAAGMATATSASRPAGAAAVSPRTRQLAAIVAAVFASAALLGIEDYMHYILSAQSDPMIVAFVLAAIDSHLSGRPRLAIVLGVLASLGRPEAWPFLGAYGLWCWVHVPKMRWVLVAGAAVTLFMWFGVPTITNDRPFVSAQLALNSTGALKHDQIIGTLSRLSELYYFPMWIAAAVGALLPDAATRARGERRDLKDERAGPPTSPCWPTPSTRWAAGATCATAPSPQRWWSG